MKRFLLSTLTILVSLGTLAAARQVEPGNEAADINGDGVVTLEELRDYNRDERDGYHKN